MKNKQNNVKLSEKIPHKTAIGYKVFYLKDGKLYPPMVKNPGGSDTPMNVWIDANAGDITTYSKTGRPQIEKGGEGTHCSTGLLAYRPGWHLGTVPIAKFRNQQVEKKTTITKANKFLNNKEKTMKNSEKDITAKKLQNYIENLKIKYPSKWAEAVKEDAVDLVGNYIEWHGEDAPFKAENVKDLLNGAKDWKQYSQGGLGLIYDVHIAQHYCTQSELKKLGFKEGDGIIKAPNAKELWPDIQARALFQASELIKKSVRDMEMNRGLGIEQKSSAKAKEEDFGMER